MLALSAYDDPAYVRQLLDEGAAGYITKEKAPSLVVEAVIAVAEGQGRWFVMPKSENYLICQYKVVFDTDRLVRETVWRRRQCSQIAAMGKRVDD